MGSFERFTFSPIEARVTPPFQVFIRTSQTREGRFQTTVLDPNGKIVLGLAFSVNKTSFSEDMPATVDFLDRIQIPVPIEGTYWFDVSFNGESLGGAPLVVVFEKHEEVRDEPSKTGDAQ